MNYFQLVDYLLEKYGEAKHDYFCNETCKTRNPKVSRAKEGLECHHIAEYEAVLLSTTTGAKMYSYEYQLAENLVYCNLIEHLLLHIKIVEEKGKKDKLLIEGMGGVKFISRKLNDLYNGKPIQKDYLKIQFDLIKNNFDDYISVLKYAINLKNANISKSMLSCGWFGNKINKVYKEL